MFERFTDRANWVIVLAQEEARRFNHSYTGTEHILLGLISVNGGAAAEALVGLGVSLEAVRAQVEKDVGLGQDAPTSHIPFTPRAKQVLELSLREALRLDNVYIATEHLLLGIVREGGGVAVQILENLGVDLNQVRQVVNRSLGVVCDPVKQQLTIDVGKLGIDDRIDALIQSKESVGTSDDMYRLELARTLEAIARRIKKQLKE